MNPGDEKQIPENTPAAENEQQLTEIAVQELGTAPQTAGQVVAPVPPKIDDPKRARKTLASRILIATISITAIGCCLFIFNKEAVYWWLVNSTDSMGSGNQNNPLIPGLTRLSFLIGKTYLPDRKYILRSLATGRDATSNSGSKESLNAEYKTWFGFSPSKEFDKHYSEAVILSKNPATLKQALKEATLASQFATDANKTSTAARAFALALCADLHRRLGRTEESLYLDRRAVLAADALWFNDDIGSVPIRLSAAKVYLSIDHIDDAQEQLSIINHAYEKAFSDPVAHGSSEEELFDVLQVNAEVNARAHQLSNADSFTKKALELAENKLKAPERIAQAYLVKAATLMEQKNWSGAQIALRNAEKLKNDSKSWNSDDVRLYLYLADAQSKMGDQAAAAKSLNDAEKYCRSKRTHARIAEYKKNCLQS